MTRILFALLPWLAMSTVPFASEPEQTPSDEQPNSPIWMVDLDQATAKAKSNRIPMLIYFSASDWCETCRKLDDEVFVQPGFINWAKDRIVLVAIDSPIDRTKLRQKTQKIRDQWLADFRVAGFPTVILADNMGRPFAITGYKNGGVSNYLRHLSQLLQLQLIRDASLKLANESTGDVKARHLETALANIDERLVVHHYLPEVKLIQQFGDDKQKAKFESLVKSAATNTHVIGTSQGNWSDDPLRSISADMKQAAVFLNEQKLEPLVLDFHPRIERRLARLVELMDASESSNGGGKASQKATNPADESSRRKRQAKSNQLGDPTPGGQDWAKLSPKQREQIMQSKAEDFPSEFHDILSDYFRRLAKEDDANSKK